MVEVRAASESDLEALIDTMRPLLLDGTVSNVPLKDALDPDGILSPGKQGIWPRAAREF